MDVNKCPYCFRPSGTWKKDPILLPNGSPLVWTSDTELILEPDITKRIYKGTYQVSEPEIQEIRDSLKTLEIEGGIIPATIFSPLNTSGKFQITGTHIKEMRDSVEKLLTASGLTKIDYFNYDDNGVHITTPTGDKLDWTDPITEATDLQKFQIKYIHIEELRRVESGLNRLFIKFLEPERSAEVQYEHWSTLNFPFQSDTNMIGIDNKFINGTSNFDIPSSPSFLGMLNNEDLYVCDENYIYSTSAVYWAIDGVFGSLYRVYKTPLNACKPEYITDSLPKPPESPVIDSSYIIFESTPPSEEDPNPWWGKDGQIATFTGSGWSYSLPLEYDFIWQISDKKYYRYLSGIWSIAPNQDIPPNEWTRPIYVCFFKFFPNIIPLKQDSVESNCIAVDNLYIYLISSHWDFPLSADGFRNYKLRIIKFDKITGMLITDSDLITGMYKYFSMGHDKNNLYLWYGKQTSYIASWWGTLGGWVYKTVYVTTASPNGVYQDEFNGGIGHCNRFVTEAGIQVVNKETLSLDASKIIWEENIDYPLEEFGPVASPRILRYRQQNAVDEIPGINLLYIMPDIATFHYVEGVSFPLPLERRRRLFKINGDTLSTIITNDFAGDTYTGWIIHNGYLLYVYYHYMPGGVYIDNHADYLTYDLTTFSLITTYPHLTYGLNTYIRTLPSVLLTTEDYMYSIRERIEI